MKYVRSFLAALGFGLLLTSTFFLYKISAQLPTEDHKYQWALDEILLQLAEIKIEQSKISSEVSVLSATKKDAGDLALENENAPRYLSAKLLDSKSKIGAIDAPVVLIEFSDYQCPYCAKYSKLTFEQIKKSYIDTGKIQYLVNSFPLDFHNNALPAAVAADCAGAQQAFWPMHKRLFENWRDLDTSLFLSIADGLNLDTNQFASCLASENVTRKVEADIEIGKSVGVSGTPAFLIGTIRGDHIEIEKLISGAQQFPVFANVIEATLQSTLNTNQPIVGKN